MSGAKTSKIMLLAPGLLHRFLLGLFRAAQRRVSRTRPSGEISGDDGRVRELVTRGAVDARGARPRRGASAGVRLTGSATARGGPPCASAVGV